MATTAGTTRLERGRDYAIGLNEAPAAELDEFLAPYLSTPSGSVTAPGLAGGAGRHGRGGKTLRRAPGDDRPPAKLIAVYDHAHQLVPT